MVQFLNLIFLHFYLFFKFNFSLLYMIDFCILILFIVINIAKFPY